MAPEFSAPFAACVIRQRGVEQHSAASPHFLARKRGLGLQPVLTGQFGWQFHPGLVVHSQPVRNPIDVVEVSNDLGGQMDLLVVPAGILSAGRRQRVPFRPAPGLT